MATSPRGPVTGEPLDSLQRLWTPWRMAYIEDDQGGDLGCPFCELPARGPELDAETLIVHRGHHAYLILNAYPYNPGHCMAVPYRHTGAFEDLSVDEADELTALSQRAVRALKDVSSPDGFNVGINLGAPAGAGIADHVHQHVVPRWSGDTNFMPVIGQTRLLPQVLHDTYERLAPAFEQAERSQGRP